MLGRQELVDKTSQDKRAWGMITFRGMHLANGYCWRWVWIEAAIRGPLFDINQELSAKICIHVIETWQLKIA
jgi:hypothetical protein